MTAGEEGHADVVVVGAGLAGIGAALAASEVGARVRLLDAAPAPGGVVRSRLSEGHRFDFGPLTMMVGHPAVKRLLAAAGAARRVRPTQGQDLARNLFVDGQLIPLPTGLLAWAGSPLLGPFAKLRALAEPLMASRTAGDAADGLTVGSLLEQRLGRDVRARVIAPLMGGIYGGGDEDLELRSALPQLHALARRGSLLVGAAPMGRSLAGRSVGTLECGLAATLADAVEGRGRGPGAGLRRFEGGTRVVALRPHPSGRGCTVEVEGPQGVEGPRGRRTLRCGTVVVASGAPEAAALLAPVDSALSEEVAAIPHVAMIQVALSVKPRAEDTLPQGYGILVGPQHDAPLRLRGVAFHHRLAPEAVPQGRWSFVCYFGGPVAQLEDLLARSDRSLVELAQQELGRVVDIDLADLAGSGAVGVVQRLREAIPQPVLGHQQRLERIGQALQTHPWLRMCGSYLSGVAVNEVLSHGLAVGATCGGGGDGSEAGPGR